MHNQMGKPVFKGEILLCEDNKMNQEIFGGWLAKVGLTAAVAENGKEGVEMAASRIQNGKKPFDLIFMDIHMPVMNGLEAATEIGKLNAGTPIVATTSNDSPAEREQYAVHGMSVCLHKPFTMAEMIDCLKKYLTPVNRDADEPQYTHDTDFWSEETLKTRMIRSFMHNNAAVYTEIVNAINHNDFTLAHRLVHSLKGNAGLLGKTRLQQAAGDAEDRLADAKRPVNRQVLDTLKAELDAVLQEYEPLMIAEDAFSPETIAAKMTFGCLDEETTVVLLTELEDLLEGGSLESLKRIEFLRRIPSHDERLVGDLIHQIEYFEFDAAMKTLAQLKKEWMEVGHAEH
jgi:CheY-like chemotaxis protein/HPt (histidine-containing phosphotransfer) domain-containing protein